MKGVYNRTMDTYQRSGKMVGGDLLKVKNHLECLSMVQDLLGEHHEMVKGKKFDAGDIGFRLETQASLIAPNGEVIWTTRRPM